MNIAIVGTGYVGLVTGVCLAERGNAVHCVDVNPSIVEKLSSGQVTIYEPGLEEVFHRNLKKGRVHFSGDLEKAVLFGDVVFLCLPTPPGEDGSADLSYILGVAHDIGTILAKHPDAGYKVVVDKSTVPVGTSEKVSAAIRENAPSADFDVVSNPEFLREGFAVEDFLRPERVVVGSRSERAVAMLTDLYEPFLPTGSSVIAMDEKSAEVTKYAANAFLAMKISYMNDLANFCDAVGADVDMIREGIGSDSRIGPKFLFPGLGYGGSCLPKDVKALLRSAQEAGSPLSLLGVVETINQEQRKAFYRRIEKHFGQGGIKGKRIAVWGVAFKPNTDDVREAPFFYIADRLLEAGAAVSAFDPEALEGARRTYGDRIECAESAYGALQGADALVVVTEWNEFRKPDFGLMKTLLKSPVVFDGRNIYEPAKMRAKGFTYLSIGRGAA